MSRPWRRSAAVLSACALALLGATLIGAPAHAADGPTLSLVALSTDVGLPQPADPDDPQQIGWSLAAPDDGTVHDVDVTLDLSGISSFADPDAGAPCKGDTCEWDSGDLGPGGTGGDVRLTAKPGAAPGATGTAVLSGTASDATLTPVTITVTVGAVGLAVSQLPKAGHAKPGSTLDAPLTVADTGQLPATGVDLRLTTTTGLGFAQHFANCVYSSQAVDPSYPTLTDDAVCHLATTLQPGRRYRLSSPLGITVKDSALWELVRYKATPRTGAAPALSGGGPVLSLVPDGAAPAGGSPGADWTVDADNTADLAAGGDSADGSPGDRVVLTAQLSNTGPASVDVETSDNQLGVMVDIPKGTTAVKVPPGCSPWAVDSAGPPALGKPRYICAVAHPFDAGQVLRLPFTLRIDAGAPAVTTGTVRATTVYGLALPFDHDHADDTATLTVHVAGGATPTASTGTTSTTGGSGGGHSGTQAGSSPAPRTGTTGGGDDSGSLASTGGDGTRFVAWTGAAALAFGAATFAVARSRRVRHPVRRA